MILIVSVTNHQSSDWLSQAQQIRKRLSQELAVIPRHKYYIHIKEKKLKCGKKQGKREICIAPTCACIALVALKLFLIYMENHVKLLLYCYNKMTLRKSLK